MPKHPRVTSDRNLGIDMNDSLTVTVKPIKDEGSKRCHGEKMLNFRHNHDTWMDSSTPLSTTIMNMNISGIRKKRDIEV